MRRALWAAARVGGIVWIISAIGIAAAQDNPLVGSWTAVDLSTGVRDQVNVTAEHITFGSATPPIPYRLEPDGEALALYLADGERPARFLFLDNANAQLRVPDGPTIALKRDVPPSQQESVIDAAAAGLLMPSYHPLDPSLEVLLTDGWQVEEVSGADDSVTLLMRHGGHHALCILLPGAAKAGSDADCRRLN